MTNEIMAEDEMIMNYELAINPSRVRVIPVEEMFRAVN